MEKVIRVAPEAISQMNTEDALELLNEMSDIVTDGIKCVEYLKKIDYNKDKEEIVDYEEYLYDVEELLFEKKDLNPKMGLKDKEGAAIYAKNAIDYFNSAVKILDIDSCSNTTLECATMLCHVSFAVSNALTFLVKNLFNIINYVEFLIKADSHELGEQTKASYSEFTEVSTVEYVPAISEFLNRYGIPSEPETLKGWVTDIMNSIKEFPTKDTAQFRDYESYCDFMEIMAEESEDLSEEEFILPNDVQLISMVYKSNSKDILVSYIDQVYNKVHTRVGDDEAVSPFNYEDADILVFLSALVKSRDEAEFIFNHERAIISDYSECYMAIASGSLNSIVVSGFETTSLFR